MLSIYEIWNYSSGNKAVSDSIIYRVYIYIYILYIRLRSTQRGCPTWTHVCTAWCLIQYKINFSSTKPKFWALAALEPELRNRYGSWTPGWTTERVRFDFQKGQFSLLSTVQTAPEPPTLLLNGYRKSLQEPPTVGLVPRVTATGGTPLNPTHYFMAFAGTLA